MGLNFFFFWCVVHISHRQRTNKLCFNIKPSALEENFTFFYCNFFPIVIENGEELKTETDRLIALRGRFVCLFVFSGEMMLI